MGVKTENRATKEQTDELIQKYNFNEKVFDILYTGKVRTLIMLEHGYEKGITITRLAGNTYPVTLPECTNGNYWSNDMYSEKMHMTIVRKILTNFVYINPQYFKLKPNSSRYAISDQFVFDLLIHNKTKEFDYIEFPCLLPYISNQDIFEQIVKIFYLPYTKNETFDNVKRKYWQKKTPFTFKSINQEETLGKNYILYGSNGIQSIKIDEFLKKMQIYYNSGLSHYHIVAYCTYFPDNLINHFPLCKIETFQSIYNCYREYKPKTGSKEKLRNDRENLIFPKYSIVDCEYMPTLWAYKKIFGRFVAEEAHRFIIFVNYHSEEVFYGTGGIGHNIFSSKI